MALESKAISRIAEVTNAQLSQLKNSTVVSVQPDQLRTAYELMRQELPQMYHLSTITAVDEGEEISLLYHFWEGKEFLSIRTKVPKSAPSIRSIGDLIPGSILYEAEIQDLFGVTFIGNPYTGSKLLLPYDYPADAPPPLRKEADPQKIWRTMNLE